MPWFDVTPSGIGARILRTRWLVRSPVLLFRAGLGWLLGRRVLMIEHVGRRSGLPRYVCLEVVGHPAPGRLLVVSGFGTGADWYRNLRRHPACFVSWGHERHIPAVARFLPPARSRAVLDTYATRHPAAWRTLRRTIGKAGGAHIDALPVVELDLDESRATGRRRGAGRAAGRSARPRRPR